MLTPDQFKLLGTLPGLYYARDTIQQQIDAIELQFANPKQKRGRPSKVKAQIESQEVEKLDSIGRRIVKQKVNNTERSQKMKEYWANMPEDQKIKRRRKMGIALRKAHAAKKAAQNLIG